MKILVGPLSVCLGLGVRRPFLERRSDPGAGVRPGSDAIQLARESYPRTRLRGSVRNLGADLVVTGHYLASTLGALKVEIDIQETGSGKVVASISDNGS